VLYLYYVSCVALSECALASTHFPLLFPHGDLGCHLAVRYQGVPISHNNNTVSNPNFAAYRLHQIQWINIDPSRCTFSILITEIRVPSLPVSPGASKLVLLLLPVSYSQKYSRNKPLVKMFLIKVRVLQSEKIVTNGRRL